MKLNVWYIQKFQNGDEIYFNPSSVLKNGNYAGMQVEHIPGWRKKPKAVKTSVFDPSLWREANEVPGSVIAAWADRMGR